MFKNINRDRDNIMPEQNLEIIECNAWREMLNSISDKNIKKYGVEYKKYNAAEAYLVSSVDMPAYNRVIYNNHDAELNLEEIIELFRSKKVPRFFFQINPSFLTEELKNKLLGHGFKYYNNWTKLYRDSSPVKDVDSELVIEQIGNGSVTGFSDIIIKSFEWNKEFSWFFSDFVSNGKLYDGKSGWIFYLGYYKHKPVATAVIYIEGDSCWLSFAATLKEFRKLGGQHALLRQRLFDGINNGCKHFIVETAENLPEKKSQSYLNLLDMGFEKVYLRSNYIFYR